MKGEDKILKATRVKWQITYKGTPIRFSTDFSTETLQARKEWDDIFKVMKGKNLQPRLVYPAKLCSNLMEKSKALQTKTIKKMVIGSYILIITLNVNGLNAPTKRHRLAGWIQKQDPNTCCLQETHLRPRDTYRLKVRRWEKVFHENRNQMKAGVAILIAESLQGTYRKEISKHLEDHCLPS